MRQAGDTEATADLPEEGIYEIIKITHTGDTFCNDWYSDIVGFHSRG